MGQVFLKKLGLVLCLGHSWGVTYFGGNFKSVRIFWPFDRFNFHHYLYYSSNSLAKQSDPICDPIHFFCVLSHKLGFSILVICFVVCSNQCPCYIAIVQIYFAITMTKRQNIHSFIKEIDKLCRCTDQHSNFEFLIISKLRKKSKVFSQQLVLST